MKLTDMTVEQLVAYDKALCADPANRNPDQDSLYKYTPATHRKLDKIAREIVERTRQLRIARGDQLNNEGYSGRQSNKR